MRHFGGGRLLILDTFTPELKEFLTACATDQNSQEKEEIGKKCKSAIDAHVKLTEEAKRKESTLICILLFDQ